MDENSCACYQPPECRFTILYGNVPSEDCHPERSEGSMESACGKKMHRSFASLRMTIFAQDYNVISVQSVPGKIA